MQSASAGAKDPTLLGITVRRAIVLGRLYLVIGMIYVVIFAIVLGLTSSSGFDSAYPLILPIFAVVSTMGALMVFTNDRIKGVLEYLLAYGFSPRRLFVNVMLASLVLASIVLALSLGIAFGIRYGSGQGFTTDFDQLVLVYSLPMSYASVAFAVTVGMYWTSLSSPRSGINSPVGLAPIVGIGPPIATLVLIGFIVAATSVPFIWVAGGAAGIIALAVLVLLTQIQRLMPLERLLSPT